VNDILFDVLGVGANSVDYVYRLPEFPDPDTSAAKLPIAQDAVLCGGQTATALCTCAAMGLRAKYVGAIGDDDNGRRIRRELERRGVNVDHTYVHRARNAFAVILVDGRRGERVVLWHRDAALALQPGELDASVVAASRLVHVDDTDEDAAFRAASLARSAGVPVTSDIERLTERTEKLVAAVTIPIFAEHVLEQLTGERDVERALRMVQSKRGGSKPPPPRLRRSTEATGEGGRTRPTGERGPVGPGDDLICVTLGAQGAMLLEGDQLHHVSALRVEVVDTTGAGDVFRGAFMTALLRGDSPEEILRFANAAAALSCTRVGAIDGVPTLQETLTLARGQP
jgi:sulfofructose kinase